MATLGIVRNGFWDIVAAAPIFAVVFYGLTIAWVNRVRVEVDWWGARITCGPLPAMPHAPFVSFQDVEKVYVRHAQMPTKSGSIRYLAAGLQRKDGRWVDLSEPLIPDEEVWREAWRIARALSWPRGVVELDGLAPRTDWQAAHGVWYWTGAFLASLGWGVFVEFWLRRQ
jgi:hypothetical protein